MYPKDAKIFPSASSCLAKIGSFAKTPFSFMAGCATSFFVDTPSSSEENRPIIQTQQERREAINRLQITLKQVQSAYAIAIADSKATENVLHKKQEELGISSVRKDLTDKSIQKSKAEIEAYTTKYFSLLNDAQDCGTMTTKEIKMLITELEKYVDMILEKGTKINQDLEKEVLHVTGPQTL